MSPDYESHDYDPRLFYPPPSPRLETPMTDLPPLPDIEQAIYERCRRFIEADAQEAVAEMMREYARMAVEAERARLQPFKPSLSEGPKPDPIRGWIVT